MINNGSQAHGVFIFDPSWYTQHTALINRIFDDLTTMCTENDNHIGIESYQITDNYVKFDGNGKPTFSDWLTTVLSTPIMASLTKTLKTDITINFNDYNDSYDICYHEQGHIRVCHNKLTYQISKHTDYPYTLPNLIKLGCTTGYRLTKTNINDFMNIFNITNMTSDEVLTAMLNDPFYCGYIDNPTIESY